ncbi:MAG: twin-arginine translocase subunit TatC [Bacillaceae bacterium]
MQQEMTIVEHLSELRKRIIITLVSFIVFTGVGLYFATDIYAFLVKDLDVKLAVLGPSDILWLYFMLAAIVGITGTIPLASLQVWLFVKPALSPKEQRVSLMYIPFLFLLFIGGLAFGYFVIMPMIFKFLIGLGNDLFQTMFTTQRYFSFVFSMTIPFGFLFELPLVVMFLTSLGIVNPVFLRKIRRYAYFVLVVIAVCITPPDFISDFIVIIPLLVLYEVSVTLSAFVFRKKLKMQEKIES